MAPLDRDRWRELQPLVDRALELPAQERASWLEELRAGSPALAAELTAFLAGEDAADRHARGRSGFAQRPRDADRMELKAGRVGVPVFQRLPGAISRPATPMNVVTQKPNIQRGSQRRHRHEIRARRAAGAGPWPAGRLYLTWKISERHGLRARRAVLAHRDRRPRRADRVRRRRP
jgi:hypothetical protein